MSYIFEEVDQVTQIKKNCILQEMKGKNGKYIEEKKIKTRVDKEMKARA